MRHLVAGVVGLLVLLLGLAATAIFRVTDGLSILSTVVAAMLGAGIAFAFWRDNVK